MPRVIVPWRGGCPHRQQAWAWVKPRYRWPVDVALGNDPWVKALAVMPAVAASPAGEIVVVADADVWCDNLETAVQQVAAGAPWAVPHGDVHRLTKAATATVLAGGPWQDQPTVQAPYPGIVGGGIVVARRETLLACPLDPRFVGWGQEDEAWGMALDTLHGPPWRGTSPLLHLWHPAMPRASRSRGSQEGWTLKRRYARARRDPAVMLDLVKEAQDACDVAQ